MSPMAMIAANLKYDRVFLDVAVFKNSVACYLEAEGLFPPVTIFLDLFLRASYFFNAFD